MCAYSIGIPQNICFFSFLNAKHQSIKVKYSKFENVNANLKMKAAPLVYSDIVSIVNESVIGSNDWSNDISFYLKHFNR